MFKRHVGVVPDYLPRGDAVHIALEGVEVTAMPTEIFLAASDKAAAVAERIRSRAAVAIPIGRGKRRG